MQSHHNQSTRKLKLRFTGAHLVHLEPFEETSHILFLHVASKLTASGFFNRHVLVTVTLEFGVYEFSLAMSSEVPGRLARLAGDR
jgi:hypothetical protein